MRTKFLTARERSYKQGKGEARINAAVLDGRGREQCELMAMIFVMVQDT